MRSCYLSILLLKYVLMKFNRNEFYHIYNRGNDRQKIFLEERNYSFFLEKIKKELTPICSILSYCLMPNHYHILIYTGKLSKSSDHSEWSDDSQLEKLPRKIGTLQSSYTRAICKMYGKSGSLFQQKAKSKNLSDSKINYLPETCFHYIHQNPLKSRLVNTMQDYMWSSFREYLQDKPYLCEIELAKQVLEINFNELVSESNSVIKNYDIINSLET